MLYFYSGNPLQYLSGVDKAADCDAYQQGKLVGSLDRRRQSITIPKSRNDAEIRCTASGYKDKVVTIVSEASAWGVVGALTLDFGLIDYATGALNKYPASLQIVMEQDAGASASLTTQP